ncbi:uncharacterized protein LOC135109049 isoform X2 [Scylla paramamosain]|uniref:uncharacterized protein LOC135109049 isoform X2 n=1 Tax=Scylla paramamosain TaxID=85552 RepID=UPI0030832883
MLENLKAEHKRINALITKVELLQESVSLNVGTTPAPATSLPALRVPDATNVPVPAQEDFLIVRNNMISRRRIVPITTCQNCFQIHSDTGDDEDTEEEGVENILSDILSTNTGAEMPHITPKYLLAHSNLGDITETISKNFENLNLKKFEHLIKEKRMATTKEKYKKMDSRDLLDLLMMSPFCKNINYVKDEVQENNNCTETEYGNTSKGTVFLVLSKALNSLVPQSVWGSQENYNRMEFFMWQLLDMGVHDTISIGVLLDGMQLKDVRML